MAAKGLNFVNYSFARYVFEEGNPMEYIYRIELLESLPKTPQSRSYIEFMEEAGVECVATYYRWVYFRKKRSDGEFDLYSDYDSRIKHYKRIAALLGSLSALNLFAALYNLIIGLYIGHEKGFYFNVYFSIISWIVFGVLISLYISYKKKIKRMKKEKQIYE